MKRLSMGLESEQVIDNVENETIALEQAEEGLRQAVAATDEELEVNDSTFAAMESLSMIAGNIEYLMASKTATSETLDLAVFGAQQQMNRVQASFPMRASLESITDINEQHEIALEGIRDVWKRLAQHVIITTKHSNMILLDALRSNSALVASYQKKNIRAKAEFDTDKIKWRDQRHTGSLTELWYHFATDKGQVTALPEAVGKDVALSKYILDTYPTALLAEYEKLVAVIGSSSAKDLPSIVALAKKMEALSHPVDLFNKGYVVPGHPYLSVTGLEESAGTTHNPVSIGNVAFTKLAALATPRTIVETWSKMHAAKKVHHQVIINPVRAVPGVGLPLASQSGKTIELSTDEISGLFVAAQAYLDNIKQYNAHATKFAEVTAKLPSVLGHLTENVGEVKAEEFHMVHELMAQIEQFGLNIQACFKKPALQEISRSLKGSKYCRYLGLRMISNAK